MSSPIESGRILSYGDALCEAVAMEMERDESVFVIGLNVTDHKAILGSTRGLVQRFGPDRVIESPLSEDAVTGIATGAAMAGLRPIHVHIRMDFLMLCMNQLVNMSAKAHYMYNGQLKAPMVVRAIIGKSWGQGAQHSQALHGMFMHVPGLKVVAPSNAYDAKGCMIAAIRDNNPVIFVEHRMLYYTDAFVPEESYTVEFGKARIVRPGDDITVVGISNMLVESLRAQELLAEIGISAEVIDPISLAPLDMDAITKSVRKTGRLLVVDNAWTSTGASAEILAGVAERLGGERPIMVSRMGFAPTTCPTTSALEKGFYPTPVTIASRIHRMVRPDAAVWEPDAGHAEMAYQLKFRGPF
ncbi:MAG: acetoin dehydrogenase [Rhodospirillales bacterium RIFCSPLOWO2_12_FULL_58_28]|nr:MAG: acetoin dehydrogenase [Rhodospirillales bacterium RIFCSPLOWO2_02_FULL_58_16]OHC79441.1 MAG: acetoin dehydrogenase [Rhodospirillales bacterium RIFCSPLOWO2_12_FULL_58_28]